MIGGILFFVIELKPGQNSLAQLFLELLCVYFIMHIVLRIEPTLSRCRNEQETRLCRIAHLWPFD